MSIAVPVVESFNGEERRIYLKEGVGDFYPIEDIYHEYREARRLDEELRKFEPLIKAEGNVNKGAGKYTPRYVVLLTADSLTTKIVPFDEPLDINQKGDIITDIPDTDTDVYDTSGFTGPKAIYVEPPGAEVIRLDSVAIAYSSFNGGVTIDITSEYSGTGDSVGTPRKPVNNFEDAELIATTNGFDTLYILGDITIGAGDDVSGYKIVGQNASRTAITIEDEAITDSCEIIEASVTGYLDNGIIVRNCVLNNIHYLDGVVFNTMLNGYIMLGSGAIGHFLNCYSGVPGSSTPEINMGGSGQGFAMRQYNGGIYITNKTGADAVSIDMNSGQVKLDPDPVTGVINGEIVIRGTGKAINSVTGEYIALGEVDFNGATVINETTNPFTVADQVHDETASEHIQPGSFGELVGKKLLKISTFLGLK